MTLLAALRAGAALAARAGQAGFCRRLGWCFLTVAAGAAVLEWALTSLLTFRLLPPLPGAFQAGLAAGLYPLLALLLVRAHQTLAEPERA